MKCKHGFEKMDNLICKECSIEIWGKVVKEIEKVINN